MLCCWSLPWRARFLNEHASFQPGSLGRFGLSISKSLEKHTREEGERREQPCPECGGAVLVLKPAVRVLWWMQGSASHSGLLEVEGLRAGGDTRGAVQSSRGRYLYIVRIFIPWAVSKPLKVFGQGTVGADMCVQKCGWGIDYIHTGSRGHSCGSWQPLCIEYREAG